MFWCLYKSPNRVEDPNKPWPIILWLQGGPGASGVGIGNFLEIGPQDVNLRPRTSTWLAKADLLFVDSPVGTGYSYVEDETLLAKTDEEAVKDLTKLLVQVFNRNLTTLSSSNAILHIIGESYGGRLGASLALSALNAGDLKLKLGGVTLGSTWTSPEDSVLSWGPVLKDFSRIDENGLEKANSMAMQIKEKIDGGQFAEARNLSLTLQGVISEYTNSVDLYNIMRDSYEDVVSPTASNSLQPILYKLMNGGVIKDRLKVPPNVSWEAPSVRVYDSLVGDFMRPRINEVDELLLKGVDVTIYAGQVDLVAPTKGTEAWVHKLKWEGIKTFLSTNRTPIYCAGNYNKTKGFSRTYKNFHFYWILEAGHFVPADQPCASLEMVGNIVKPHATFK
ncbi:unnamed protein product [Cuscuta campestris]|uniref:Carboxypeptidase n=1 Tax=Cuscuta campestris TaxID=132261 RepID=A0A484M436_9ASTE|nr:unnamed protein product [Cuscuta campestris]